MFHYHSLSLHPFPRPQSTEIAIDISQAKLVSFHNYGSVAAPCSPSQSPLLWQLLRPHHALSAFASDSAVHLVSILSLARMPVDVPEATSVSRSSYLDSIFAIALQTLASFSSSLGICSAYSTRLIPTLPRPWIATRILTKLLLPRTSSASTFSFLMQNQETSL